MKRKVCRWLLLLPALGLMLLVQGCEGVQGMAWYNSPWSPIIFVFSQGTAGGGAVSGGGGVGGGTP